MYGYARLVSISLVLSFAAPGVATAENAKSAEAGATPSTNPQAGFKWLKDYAKAWRLAKRERKMLFIYFHRPADAAFDNAFHTQAMLPAMNDNRRTRFVFAKLPLDASQEIDGAEAKLLSHPSFRHNGNRRGVAIIDLAHPQISSYGYVVSSFPFEADRHHTSREIGVILDLPRGTLTQRTMVYAVRIHPESPLSTHGTFSPLLMQEAESHSRHQASIGVQGHHNWGSRLSAHQRGLARRPAVARGGGRKLGRRVPGGSRHRVCPQLAAVVRTLERREQPPAVLWLRHENGRQRCVVRHGHLWQQRRLALTACCSDRSSDCAGSDTIACPCPARLSADTLLAGSEQANGLSRRRGGLASFPRRLSLFDVPYRKAADAPPSFARGLGSLSNSAQPVRFVGSNWHEPGGRGVATTVESGRIAVCRRCRIEPAHVHSFYAWNRLAPQWRFRPNFGAGIASRR